MFSNFSKFSIEAVTIFTFSTIFNAFNIAEFQTSNYCTLWLKTVLVNPPPRLRLFDSVFMALR